MSKAVPTAKKPKSASYENRFSKAELTKMLLVDQLKGLWPYKQFVTEYKFYETRRWKFDVAHPFAQWAFEIEGGIWIQGGHNRGKGFIEDMEKYNHAAAHGWRVFRFSTEQVEKGEAIAWLKANL